MGRRHVLGLWGFTSFIGRVRLVLGLRGLFLLVCQARSKTSLLSALSSPTQTLIVFNYCQPSLKKLEDEYYMKSHESPVRSMNMSYLLLNLKL